MNDADTEGRTAHKGEVPPYNDAISQKKKENGIGIQKKKVYKIKLYHYP